MGVEGLYRFINKNLNDVFTSIDIHNIRGQSCIIDGIQHIYSQLIYLRSKEKEIITLNGKNISHIHGLLNSLTYYLKNGIIPIFIFDGKSPEIKKKPEVENLKDVESDFPNYLFPYVTDNRKMRSQKIYIQ
jgi:flap endonuclease-1